LIVGAGPAGLTLANLLGLYGLSVIVVESSEELIDYPRGVSMDDETLRVFQTAGLVEAVRKHTASDQWIRYITAKGRCFASVEPHTREFGWPRRNSFIQPLVDRILLAGLERFDRVEVLFERTLAAFTQDDTEVTATVKSPEGNPQTIGARFIVGCDGGRSTVRKILGISFEGKTDSTRWLVIDIRNDPLGIPDAYLFCDPARPHVSMALPHGIRRFEFMVFDHETDDDVSSAAGMHKLLALVLPDPDKADIIRGRVYSHHARLAKQFLSDRALLAGDAAHLMPVWQGQGFNSGVRDASNIAWKLAAIVKGLADRRLLSTYETERREHAAAMISLSVLVGRIFSPTNRWLAKLRDAATFLLGAIPPMRAYILQMRFKPMPRYTTGAVVNGQPNRKITVPSAIGRMFPQPEVMTPDGRRMLFDDAIGPWFAVVSWMVDPRHYMDAAARDYWQRMGARFVTIVPETQLAEMKRQGVERDGLNLADLHLGFKDWFGRYQVSTVILRPDRFVAAAVTATEISEATRAFRAVTFAP
jgi:3-(3-hydroxy-phenyl)propionate hydroxylase